jgi:hypothetical protein
MPQLFRPKNPAVLLITSLLILTVNPLLMPSVSAHSGIPQIILNSPIQDAVYNTNNVKLTFTVTPDDYVQIRYGLMGPDGVTTSVYIDNQFYAILGIHVDTSIKLSNGEHTIKLVAEETFDNPFGPPFRTASSSLVTITVNNGVAPTVSVIGFEVFKTGDASFNVTTDVAEAMVCYSLDGQANVTLPSNQLVQWHGYNQYIVNFTGLADGAHVLKAYAKDALNNTGTYQKTFTVDDSTQQPTPPHTSDTPIQNWSISDLEIGLTAATIAIIATIALLLFFNKRKTSKKEKILES